MTPDEVYELCPICEGDEEGCVWCDGVGFVVHECEPDFDHDGDDRSEQSASWSK